jgi:hypothetical protein
VSLAQTLAAQSDLELRHQTIAALTSVGRVLAWINPDQGTIVTPQAQRDILQGLIVSVSGLVLSYMNRDTLARAARTENYTGSRTGRIVLRHWPVLSVTSVRSSPATTDMSPDMYTLEAQGGGAQRLLAADGASLHADRGGLSVSYESGYVRAQRVTVPSGLTVQAESHLLADEGVVDADGELVDSSLYTLSDTGLYTFDASLEDAQLTLVFSYVPEDIEQVVVEEVGLAWRSRLRIGEASKALPNGGGTSSYTPRKLADISMQALRNYVRVVPT